MSQIFIHITHLGFNITSVTFDVKEFKLLVQKVASGLTGCGAKPVTIAPKVTLNSAHVIPVLPVSAAAGSEGSGTVFLAPCDMNGHITHFVLTAATSLNSEQLTSLLISPSNKLQVNFTLIPFNRIQIFSINGSHLPILFVC